MEGGTNPAVTTDTPPDGVGTGSLPVAPIPDWQRVVIDRLRAAPNATVKEHATALGVTERWLGWLIGSDAFKALMARSQMVSYDDPSGDPGPPVAQTQTGDPSADPLHPAPAPKLDSPPLPIRAIPPSALRGSATGARLQRLSFTHDAMVDEIIRSPGISKSELSNLFGFPMKSINRILASDAFRLRVAERKRDIIDPSLVLSVEETLTTLLNEAAEVVSDAMIAGDRRTAVRVLDTIGRYLGAGKAQTNVAVNNYVAVVPSKAQSAQAWVEAHGPTPLAPPVGI